MNETLRLRRGPPDTPNWMRWACSRSKPQRRTARACSGRFSGCENRKLTSGRSADASPAPMIDTRSSRLPASTARLPMRPAPSERQRRQLQPQRQHHAQPGGPVFLNLAPAAIERLFDALRPIGRVGARRGQPARPQAPPRPARPAPVATGASVRPAPGPQRRSRCWTRRTARPSQRRGGPERRAGRCQQRRRVGAQPAPAMPPARSPRAPRATASASVAAVGHCLRRSAPAWRAPVNAAVSRCRSTSARWPWRPATCCRNACGVCRSHTSSAEPMVGASSDR